MLWIGVVLFVTVDGTSGVVSSTYETEAECERSVERTMVVANAAPAVRSFSGACIEEGDMTRKKSVPRPSKEPPPKGSGS